MSRSLPDQSISQETMNDIFNKAKYQQRIENNEYHRIDTRRGTKPEEDVLRDIGDVVSVGTFCFDENGNELLYTHHYESPNGHKVHRDKSNGAIMLTGTRMEPKRMVHEGVRYHLIPKLKNPKESEK